MNARTRRALGAVVLLIASGASGYQVGVSDRAPLPIISTTTVAAPAAGSTRIVYSLTAQDADKELIAVIDGAKTHIYFAIYTFTHKDIAEALARAKARGVDVRGVVDSGQFEEQFSSDVREILENAGIPLVTEKHPGGNGIMHLKMLVTDSTYAHGSYNWTNSATTINDELLEIGTDPIMRKVYEDFLLRLLEAYKGNPAAAPISTGTIPYTEAPNHIGEQARVTGTLLKAYTAKSGVTFLDFCKDYKTCPFTAVIFADDIKKFPDLDSYVGKTVTLTGKIKSYQGKAEIILEDSSQLLK
jgi:PLD-like domain